MITLKPLPREGKNRTVRPKKPDNLMNFTIRAISKSKLDRSELAWVAGKVASMLGKKKANLSNNEINTAIEYIRFLLSKMHLLKTKRLATLAREILSPGESHKTRISSFVRPRRALRSRSRK